MFPLCYTDDHGTEKSPTDNSSVRSAEAHWKRTWLLPRNRESFHFVIMPRGNEAFSTGVSKREAIDDDVKVDIGVAGVMGMSGCSSVMHLRLWDWKAHSTPRNLLGNLTC